MIQSVPALLLGIVMAAYWGRVLRMAYKARKRSGRAGNLIPREPVGRILRLIWTPIVLLWIGQPFVSAFSLRPPVPLRPLYHSPALLWAAACIAISGLAASRYCWKTMGRAWRMGIDPDEANPLIATGPFAYVRHPIYAISQVMMAAVVLALPSRLMMAAGALHLVLLQWEARREEAHMLRLHGQRYADYRASVGRFVPRFRERSCVP